MTRLLFMGQPGYEDDVRCRVYGDDAVPDHDDLVRRAFVRELARGWVETESPSHCVAVAALEERGWATSRLEPARDHGINDPGRVKVWTLTPAGREALFCYARS